MLAWFFFLIISFLICLVPILLSVAFLTLIERKILGAIQRRKGPNLVGWFGLLQPFADALKLLFKEIVFPGVSDRFVFILSSFISFFLSLTVWVIVPFGCGCVLADISLGVLFFFSMSSLNAYSIIMAGWSSNSRYAFLGALRSVAQVISYEVSMGLLLMPVFLASGSLNLTRIVLSQHSVWYFVPFLPSLIFFFISSLAETNRAPFDLPEAEAELVSGYNVEYASSTFALFFIAEYSNIILMSAFSVVVFFGGWLAPSFAFFGDIGLSDSFIFSLKVLFFMFSFVWVRASLPRYRYDQLMNLGWKIFLPFSLGWLFFIFSILIFFVI